MEYVTLPGTDLRVSRICLGTMQVSPCRALLRPCSLIGLRCGLQFAGSTEDSALNEEDITWGAIAQAEVNDAVEGALAAGVNFFDTAEVYPPPPLAVHRTAPLTVGTDWWWGRLMAGGRRSRRSGRH